MAKEKLTPADKKFIAKFLNVVDSDFDAGRTFIRKNVFCGTPAEMTGLEAKAIDFAFAVLEAVQSFDEAALKRIHPELKMSNAVSNLDRAKYIVLKMNPEAYMTLLD